MPLTGYASDCEVHASKIVSQEKGRRHIAKNVRGACVTHYRIDGVVIKQGNKCDYLLINEDTKDAYLIELKGRDLIGAAQQLEATEIALRTQLLPYSIKYRIVASKCRTQEIESSEFKKFKRRCGNALRYQTNQLEECI